MSTPKRSAALVVSWLLIGLPALADSPAALQQQGAVNDFAGVLDASAESRIQQIVDQLERDTSAEIVVITVSDSGAQTPKQLAGVLFNAWGVGKKDKNNGLVLLLALEQRRIETEVGYGLETVLTDPLTVQVLEQTAVPQLKQRKFGEAMVAVASRFAELIRRGEKAGAVGALVPEKEAAPAPRATSRAAPPRKALAQREDLSAGWSSGGTKLAVLLLSLLGVFGFQVAHRALRRFPGPAFLATGIGAAAVPGILHLTGVLPVEAWVFGGGMGLSTLGMGLSLLKHRCPQCQKWMDIKSETLRSPTYSSSGEARKTSDCAACGYHDSKIVTLPRRTRSSSSSSRSSGGSRRSSGGGRSGGRGGGASW